MKKFIGIFLTLFFLLAPAKSIAADTYSIYLGYGSTSDPAWVVDGPSLVGEAGVGSGDYLHGFAENGQMVIKSNSGNVFRFAAGPGSRNDFIAPVPEGCLGVGTSIVSCPKINKSGPEAFAPRLTGPARVEVNDIGCGARETGVFLSSIYEFLFQSGYLINSSGSSYRDYLYSGGTVNGCGGNDVIAGGGKIYGGSGNDLIDVYESQTTVFAGGDNDTVSAVGVNGVKIYGESGSDYIEARGNGNKIYGGSGGDVIDIGGNSSAFGGAGSDGISEYLIDSDKYTVRIYGDAGNDYIESANGRDFLFGGPGNDRVLNGQTMIKDYMSGPFTINVFQSSGRDVINCGPGRDYAQLEKKGKSVSCEKKKYFPVTVKTRV